MSKNLRKLSKKSLGTKALNLWKEIIKRPRRCEVCGKPANQPHHIIGSKNLTLKFDLRNGCCLCYQHHTGGRESAHNEPMWFMGWLRDNRPDDYDYLQERRHIITHNCDYESIIEKLKNEL